MKIGDKVYCIKSIGSWFIEGKSYKIKVEFPYYSYGIDGVTFITKRTPPNKVIGRRNFEDYFITTIQSRKLKLKKLNEEISNTTKKTRKWFMGNTI